MKRRLTLALVIALLVPGAALASSSSTCQNYNPQLCSVASNTASKTPTTTTTTTTTSSSTLPFTGLDVVLLAAGGGTLLGAGLVIRRLSSHTSE
jgi:hypothetical protein